MNISQDEKIEKINDLYKSHKRQKLDKEEITESFIDKLYDLMFLSKEFNEDEIKDSNELYYFAKYYDITKDYDKMKKYYLKAIKLNHNYAMYNLGHHYHHTDKNYDLMKKYYLKAIELNNGYAMGNLGYYYQFVEKDYNLMKKYYLMAIKLNNDAAMNNLGYYYKNVEKNYDLMKKYYVMATERGNQLGIKNLNNYYLYNTDYSFLELYNCDNFRECCTDLINIKFNCDNIVNLPNNYKQIFLKLDFSDNENIINIVKIKQKIYKLTLIFPSNYNGEYLEQYLAIESIVQNNECTTLNKDLLLHIAGRLFI